MGDAKTHASYDPAPWVARCDANSSGYSIDTGECYALANIYAQLDGPDWNANIRAPDVERFSNTDVDNRYGVSLESGHVNNIQLYGFGNPNVGAGEVVNFA